VRDFAEPVKTKIKQLRIGAYRTQAQSSYRGAAKEGEYRFRLATYAPRGVFELRIRKKSLAFCTEEFLPLARSARRDVTMALTRCQVARDE